MIAQSPTSKNNEGNMRMRDVDGREYTKRLLKQRVESRAEKKEKYTIYLQWPLPQIFGPSAASDSKSAFHTGWNAITVANLQIIWREKSAESVYWTAPKHETFVQS